MGFNCAVYENLATHCSDVHSIAVNVICSSIRVCILSKLTWLTPYIVLSYTHVLVHLATVDNQVIAIGMKRKREREGERASKSPLLSASQISYKIGEYVEIE